MKLLLFLAALSIAQIYGGSVVSKQEEKVEGRTLKGRTVEVEGTGNVYFIGEDYIDDFYWDPAMVACEEMGMHLVSFETKAEFNAVFNVLNSYETGFNYWTSGQYNTKNEIWEWHTNYGVVPVNETQWSSGYPTSGGDYNCIWCNNGLWKNQYCGFYMTIMCERLA